ncbi:PTS system N-acetylglucosamine-specific IIA component [Streptosporangium becharense]|uniref:PTS system N-acetylglucosamine-specific IIA component n=1 Tax=Streptosporangium becharense TaxID=1816182 RepID=A0A7W9IEL7_9ACTN|nr:PTS glucose transporter subunit IIA [Streptosporangium becharense]MBB2909741.1 PTS system N-acetylglucosamine-specific IIA component [Streptosporangium becharense]MBB5819303.1 PTS system N-acetylglucosamine-specific IIA component [Streptosporangium becharense]
MTTVLAPVAGAAVGLESVPDPVFAEGLVGPGMAIEPDRAPGRALSPITGTIVKLHPHAFVVVDDDGRGVLVHLGIDTVQLRGEGFELLAAEGDRVSAGQPVVAWDPALVEAGGRSPVCPVVALDAPAGAVTGLAEGSVDAGSELFEWR